MTQHQALDVESFGVSHDAAEPMFYVFHYQGRKLALMTDTGYVSDRMKGIIRSANVFVFESNHDVGMLQMGRYPWSIKRRILSDVGHVSNEDAALAMTDVRELSALVVENIKHRLSRVMRDAE